MVHTSVAFLHVHIDAMWMTGLIEPGSVVNANRIDNECVIPIPMAHRVSVIPCSWPVLAVHILGKFLPVRPDFTPYPLVLGQLQNQPIPHLSERHSPCFVKH